MSYNAPIETREIADDALDGVAGGSAGLQLHGSPQGLHGAGGAELLGHGVFAEGAANLQSGTASLRINAF
ncbi:hypothetical protein [Streptomyces sp. Da 82-17]|uniref:hypothetical protein n=1 Tax=Streptomyces sp. Da 82-17 TaxID=3377116 RepID=UPI0038D35802